MDVLQGITVEQWPEGFTRAADTYLFDFYPPDLQGLCLDAVAAQDRASRQLITLVRWRYDDDSWSAALAVGPERLWSADGESWHRLRLRSHFGVGRLIGGLEVDDPFRSTVQELVTADAAEPLGRELWHLSARESDPRVAVILAVSAVEVELKRFISQVLPSAEWLVVNAPTPPIASMITKYLPTLPGVDAALLRPKHLISRLDRAVQLRNKLVHVGRASSASETAMPNNKEILAASSDLLRLFDAYRGHLWALEHLSKETRLALSLPVEDYE